MASKNEDLFKDLHNSPLQLTTRVRSIISVALIAMVGAAAVGDYQVGLALESLDAGVDNWQTKCLQSAALVNSLMPELISRLICLGVMSWSMLHCSW